MKTRILLIVMLAILGWSTNVNAQVPTWQWARSAGGIGDEGFSVATDASGNVFMTGYFGATMIAFDTIILTSVGNRDIYIVKYDANGNVIWAKSAGGIGDDECNSVVTDANGNVLVTGFFSSPTITFGTFTLTNADNTGFTYDIFIVKYDASGTVLWAKSAGGTNSDNGNSVATDASGNILVTGYFSSPTITFGTFTLTNAGSSDIFIVKYDSSGNVLWAKSAGGTSSEGGVGVATDASGNVLVTGNFRSPTITFGTFTLTNSGYDDVFIVKYDSSGAVVWAKSAGGTLFDFGNSIATDASGNVLVTGYFKSDTIIFGTFTLSNTNAGNADIFIVKYDSSGAVLWAKRANGNSDGYSVATDAIGNVFVTGSFNGPFIAFDSDTLFHPSIGPDPMFIVKYSPAGIVLWAKALASGGDDQNAVATDVFGNVFVGGDFQVNLFIVGTDTLHLTSTENVFIAKIGFNNLETNTNEIKPQQTLLLSPNPFTIQTILTIQGIYHNPSLFIYNLLGQEVRSIPVGTKTRLTINRERLPAGMYFYKLIEENKEVLGVGKFIIYDF